MAHVVAIYTRVSEEDFEQPASTKRQERACRRFAESRGWEVAGIWEDVGVSAYERRVRRHAFEHLLTVVAGRRVDGVVVWKLDRLVRRVIDFERFWSRCDRAGVFLVSATEPIDSTTEMGLAVIRILVTFANVESASIGLRIRSRMEEKARAGTALCRGREFGFNESWTEVIADEAQLIREAAQRFLAGESVEAIAADWRARKLPCSRGGEWTRHKLRRVLASPRTEGHNTFLGEVVKRDCFPAILDPLTAARIRAQLFDSNSTRHPSHRFLLSGGLLRCSVCGGRLHGVTQRGSRRRSGYVYEARGYRCDGNKTKYHVSINADFLEALIVSATLDRLETRCKVHPTLSVPPNAPERLAEAYERHATALRTLAHDYYVERQLTREEWESAKEGLERRLRDVKKHYEPQGYLPAAGGQKQLKRLILAWDTLELFHRRDVIASELECATISPSSVRGKADLQRVQLKWWDENPALESPWPSPRVRSIEVWNESKWVSSTQAAAIMGMTRQTVLNLTHASALSGELVSGQFRYLRSEIEHTADHFAGTIGTSEAAGRIGVPHYLLSRWIRAGRLPAVKRGNWYRIHPDNLRAFTDELSRIRKELIDTTEAARLIGITPSWLSKLAAEGRFQRVRFGRACMLGRDQVMMEVARRKLKASRDETEITDDLRHEVAGAPKTWRIPGR